MKTKPLASTPIVAAAAAVAMLLAFTGCSSKPANGKPDKKKPLAVKKDADNKTDPVDENVPPKKDDGADEKTPESVPPVSRAPEELFEGWNGPLLTLVVTGRQDGYVEPCGCAGLKTQKGGLNRRYALVKQLQEKGWNPIPVDAGNQVRRFGRQPEIKFQITIDGLKKMDYRAVGYGPDDLRLSADELIAIVAPQGDKPTPFVCANVNLLDLAPAHRVVEAGGKKVGITAVLGADAVKKIKSDEIEASAPKDALGKVWPKLEAEKCDLYVLLAHASIEESTQLAAAFPGFQIVVTAGGAGEPVDPEIINDGKTQLVQIGTKGMYVGVIGLFDDGGEPIRYQKVPLDGRFKDSKVMMDLLASYQQMLQASGLDGLGVKPLAHPDDREFAGSEACADCHETAYEIWKKTPHAHALKTLVKPPERFSVPRHHDLECIACHVVGWDTKNYIPYKTGYLNMKSDEGLHHMGCENCHGGGKAHTDAENGDVEATDEELKALAKQMILPLEKAEDHCTKCHDLDNSPDFHKKGAFARYWDKVKHKGKD